MTAMYFIDTNVLLYAVSNAGDDQTKRGVARALLARTNIAFSAQVLQWFYAAAIAKERFGISYWDAAILAAARQLNCQAVYSEDPAAARKAVEKRSEPWTWLLS